jgi:hypothetical protein
MASIHTPLITTVSYSEGPGPLLEQTPLLTLFTPDFYCSYPIWYYDPSTPGYVWNGLEYNSAWSECQPYKATAGIYSPGICPSGQEFKQVFKAVNDDSYGNTATFWNGYCCTM